MPRTSDFIADAAAKLEILMDCEEINCPAFTDLGRYEIEQFLSEQDEASFNAGFDAAVRQILGGDWLGESNRLNYLRDRSEAYRKARG